MAFVADEKLNAVVQPSLISSAFTTLRNNYWMVFNVIDLAGHYFSRSSSLFKK